MSETSEFRKGNLPLSDLRVVEICQIAAGPFCGMLLADMGADVIKIEPPAGDAMRNWPPINEGYSENFASLNRNKRSIALNLKADEDLQIALDIIKRSDVLIENSRPGVMSRLGLDFETVRKLNPSLVYCSISAYGQTGPRASEGAFDVTMQARSGMMSVTGHEDSAPVKCGVPISDFATGLYAAYNIAATVAQARVTQQGCHIDASMLGCSLGIAALQTSEYFGTNAAPRKLGAAHPRNAPYEAYKASDIYFVIAAGNDKLWASVCEVANVPELVDDPRFKTTTFRAKNQVALKGILEEEFARDTAESWYRKFNGASVPCSLINDYAAALDDPQVHAMGWVQEAELPSGSKIKTFGAPVSINNTKFDIRRNPPQLNGDRDEILEELGR